MATQIETLYRQHYERLLLTARTLLGNDEEARDAVSDLFAQLLASRRQLRDDQAEHYLQVSVRNRCLNMLQHRRVVRATEQDITDYDADTAEQEEPPLEQVLDYVDTKLTTKTRRVVKQRYLGQMKYDEIARDMGISRVAVFKHLSHGIHQLQAHFAWYHAVATLLLLSGLAYAIIRHHRAASTPQPQLPPATEQRTGTATPTTVHYENATLATILTDMARYHHAKVIFQSEAARQLRLHYDWNQQESLADIISTLDAFESINIELHDNTLYVR